MFIKLTGPVRKSDFVEECADRQIRNAWINISEIAGITQMQDGGVWISPVNRDPANIKPQEYYVPPEKAVLLLGALKPYTINEPCELTDSQTGSAMAVIIALAGVIAQQIEGDKPVNTDYLTALNAAAAQFGISGMVGTILEGDADGAV